MSQAKVQILKNLQQSLLKIAGELSMVRTDSPRDNEIINTQLGRMQGLTQGLDFFVADYEEKFPGNKEDTAFGFPLQQQPE